MIFFFSIVSSYGGLKERAKMLGLGDNLDIRFLRKEMTAQGPRIYAINTDLQLQLEFGYIKEGRDVLEDNFCQFFFLSRA